METCLKSTKRLKIAKKTVFWPGFGCALQLKAGQNTQDLMSANSALPKTQMAKMMTVKMSFAAWLWKSIQPGWKFYKMHRQSLVKTNDIQ